MSTSPTPLRVAVATRNRSQIDLHFGHADSFQVYAVENGQAVFLEQRTVDHYCQGDANDGAPDQGDDQRARVLRAVADCTALFAARIGDGPRQRLATAGIEAVDDYPFDAIGTAIAAWFASRQE